LEFEEYDGMNQNSAAFYLVINLEMLMRGISIKLKCDGRKINLEVPHLYKLNLNIPINYDRT